jgi:hypothetical protein
MVSPAELIMVMTGVVLDELDELDNGCPEGEPSTIDVIVSPAELAVVIVVGVFDKLGGRPEAEDG